MSALAVAAQHHGGGLVLELRGDAKRELWSDALRASDRGLVRQRQRAFEFARAESGKYVEGHTAADILHRLQQAKPFALLGGMKTIEPDRVFRHLGLDHQRDVRAGGEFRQGR